MKYTLLNPSYGYLDTEAEYKGFDMEHDAAFYTEEEAKIVTGKSFNDYIKTPFTDEQINNLPFDLPNVKSWVVEASKEAAESFKDWQNEKQSGLSGIDLDLTDLSDTQDTQKTL